MQWATCLKNLEVGKMEIVPMGVKVDADDPRYGQEVHIVPCKQEDITDVWRFKFGVHELTRDCYCRPQVREQVHGRTLIIHRDTVN